MSPPVRGPGSPQTVTESRRVVSRAGQGDRAFPRGQAFHPQGEESPGDGAGGGGNGPEATEPWIQWGGQVRAMCVLPQSFKKQEVLLWSSLKGTPAISLGCRQRKFPGDLFLDSVLTALYLGLV